MKWKRNNLLNFVCIILISCNGTGWQSKDQAASSFGLDEMPSKIIEIPTPQGFSRIKKDAAGFGSWLEQLPIRQSNRVYLYNGQLKGNQNAHFAVLDLPVGKKDLQQCADVIMRLRADYLKSIGKTSQIVFYDNAKKAYACPPNPTPDQYARYLNQVFAWCGTLSLNSQLKRKQNWATIEPGDVIIQGGSPGHAVMVADVAENDSGNRAFLLLQGYMPAQDIHLLKNPGAGPNAHWYQPANGQPTLATPEWNFKLEHHKTW